MNDESKLRKWMEDYVANNNKGDFEKYGSFWTEDVIWLPPGAQVVSGKNAILQFAEPFFKNYKIEQTAAIEEIQISGNLAYIRVIVDEAYIPKSTDTDTLRNKNKGFFLFTKEAGGQWLATHCVWN